MGVQRIFLNEDVLSAGLDRVRWVYSEFENVYVSFSGGKDSTVVLNLALQVATELGRLPVPVIFIDQEGEWQTVIDYIREVMQDPRVDARWLQVPIKLSNATSENEPWLNCWEPGKTWLREKEPTSIHRNVYGTDRFGKLFTHYLLYHHLTKPVASLTGMRCEESPGRTLGLTTAETYKGVTWGAASGVGDQFYRRKHFVFSPIYDWSYTDVWKAIHDHGWPYCALYDKMYQYGVPIMNMRVSNVHHETATRSLHYMQEIEPETWDRITARLRGVRTMGQMQRQFHAPKQLPGMFNSWTEYRDYLLDNLITFEDKKVIFLKFFERMDRDYVDDTPELKAKMIQAQIGALCLNDYHGTTIDNFTSAHLPESRKRRREAKKAAAKLVTEEVLAGFE